MSIKKTKVKKLKLDTGFASKEEAAKFGYIAACIERVSDGRMLLLNPDGETYSFSEKRSKEAMAYKYTYERLMDDHRCIGAFKVLSWVKDINVEKFMQFLNKKSE